MLNDVAECARSYYKSSPKRQRRLLTRNPSLPKSAMPSIRDVQGLRKLFGMREPAPKTATSLLPAVPSQYRKNLSGSVLVSLLRTDVEATQAKDMLAGTSLRLAN